MNWRLNLITSKKEVTCIVCPIGCKIIVESDGKKINVLDGYKCKKGVEYAISEALDPKRMLTTSVKVIGGSWPLVSVKSSEPIPKNKILTVLEEVKKTKVNAPVELGEVIIKNVAGTDIDIIATKTVN